MWTDIKWDIDPTFSSLWPGLQCHLQTLTDLLQDPKTHYHSTLVKYNVLTDNQHGFRAKWSCKTQLLTLTRGFTSNMDNAGTQTDLAIQNFLVGSTWTPPQARPVQDQKSNVLLDGDLFWSHAAGYGWQCQVQPGPCDPTPRRYRSWATMSPAVQQWLARRTLLKKLCVCMCMCVCEHACVLQIQKSWSCN